MTIPLEIHISINELRLEKKNHNHIFRGTMGKHGKCIYLRSINLPVESFDK